MSQVAIRRRAPIHPFSHQALNRVLEPEDWTRFDLYAPRIRAVDTIVLPTLSPSSIYCLREGLARRNPARPLLPGVQRLSVQHPLRYQEQLDLGELLIDSTNLRIVQLSFAMYFKEHLSLVATGFCRQLVQARKTLEILEADLGGSDVVRNGVADLLADAPRLHGVTLSAGCQHPVILDALARLPALKKLDLQGWTIYDTDDPTIPATHGHGQSDHDFFPELKVVVGKPGLAATVASLAHRSSPAVHIRATIGQTRIFGPSSSVSLNINPAFASLITEVHLTVGLSTRDGPSTPILEKLLECSNLVTLDVRGCIRNVELETMITRGWPRLESLAWRSTSPRTIHHNQGVSLVTLALLSQKCPALRALDIPVETSTHLQAPADFRRWTRMTVLAVGQWLPLLWDSDKLVEVVHAVGPASATSVRSWVEVPCYRGSPTDALMLGVWERVLMEVDAKVGGGCLTLVPV